jgi:ABC-type nitrate/sulfonate/bicarbonate transport system substrate-binding protein
MTDAVDARESLKMAVGLRSTTQSIGILGIETGRFAAAGLSLVLVGMETAGPQGIAGLESGAWHFAEFGAVPIVQSALRGNDVVIIASVDPSSALFMVSRRPIDTAPKLAGGRVGVLTRAGQTGFLAKKFLQHSSLLPDVDVVEFGTYPKIYAALRRGEIEAGVLSADYFFVGRTEAGMNALVDLAEMFQLQGPCVASTRGVIQTYPTEVLRFMEGYMRTIHVFKSNPDAALPFLKRHLGFTEPVVRDIYDFYRPRFQPVPRPSMQRLQIAIDEVGGASGSTAELTPDHICDLGFIRQIEESGLIDSLYEPTRLRGAQR